MYFYLKEITIISLGGFHHRVVFKATLFHLEKIDVDSSMTSSDEIFSRNLPLMSPFGSGVAELCHHCYTLIT